MGSMVVLGSSWDAQIWASPLCDAQIRASLTFRFGRLTGATIQLLLSLFSYIAFLRRPDLGVVDVQIWASLLRDAQIWASKKSNI
mgnify:CR=1 FL=1